MQKHIIHISEFQSLETVCMTKFSNDIVPEEEKNNKSKHVCNV